MFLGSLSEVAQQMDGMTNAPLMPQKTKLSDELRRERIKYFGKSSEPKKSQTIFNGNAHNELQTIFIEVVDPWNIIADLANFIELQTKVKLFDLYTRFEFPQSNFAKAFIVILRYGFGIKRRIICQYVNITKNRCDYILDDYRERAILSPDFNDIFLICLEHAKRAAKK